MADQVLLSPEEQAVASEIALNRQGKMGAASTPFSPYSPEFRKKIEATMADFGGGSSQADRKLTADGLAKAIQTYEARGNPGFAQKRIDAMNKVAKGVPTPATPAQPTPQVTAGATTTKQTITQTIKPDGAKTIKFETTNTPNKGTTTPKGNPKLSPIPPTTSTPSQGGGKIELVEKHTDGQGNVTYVNPANKSAGTSLVFEDGSEIGAVAPQLPMQRFDPTPPPQPITAVSPQAMPVIPDSRLTSVKGLPHYSNTAEGSLDTTIKGMSPIPEEFSKAQQEVIAQRLGQINDLQQMEQGFISQYEPQQDLSPLLSWIGSQLGRDYLEGYKPPMTLQEVVGLQNKLASDTNKARAGLADSQIDYLKARLNMQDKQRAESRVADVYKKENQAANSLADERLADARRNRENDEHTREMNNYTATSGNMGEQTYIQAYTELAKDVETAYSGTMELFNFLKNPSNKNNPELGKILAKIRTAVSSLTVTDNKYVSELGALAVADTEILSGKIGASARDGTFDKVMKSLVPAEREALLHSLRFYMRKIKEKARQKDTTVGERYKVEAVKRLHASTWKNYLDQEKKTRNTMGVKSIEDLSPEEQEEVSKRAKTLKEQTERGGGVNGIAK